MDAYDPQSLNQAVIDQLALIHGQCMDHCCDADQTTYELLNTQRELLGAVCKAAAIASREWVAHCNRFNTHVEPRKQRFYRMRQQAAVTAKQLIADREAGLFN
jgi:hypothetical protein